MIPAHERVGKIHYQKERRKRNEKGRERRKRIKKGRKIKNGKMKEVKT